MTRPGEYGALRQSRCARGWLEPAVVPAEDQGTLNGAPSVARVGALEIRLRELQHQVLPAKTWDGAQGVRRRGPRVQGDRGRDGQLRRPVTSVVPSVTSSRASRSFMSGMRNSGGPGADPPSARERQRRRSRSAVP